jgi:anti-anti-sigma factor
MDFSCQVHDLNGSTVVAIAGEVDMAACDKLAVLLSRHLVGDAQMVLDCSRITFLDSVGLSTLLELRSRATSVNARLALANPSDPVLRVLEVSGTTALFDILNDFHAVLDHRHGPAVQARARGGRGKTGE